MCAGGDLVLENGLQPDPSPNRKTTAPIFPFEILLSDSYSLLLPPRF